MKSGRPSVKRRRSHDDDRDLPRGDRQPRPLLLSEIGAGSAELAKCGANGFLTTKLRFLNEIASLRPSAPTQLEAMSLDPEINEITWRDETVRLTPIEFRILYLLAKNAGHVVPASRLYTYVWGSDGGDANALRSHISHLRSKLEIRGETPVTISSVPAVGYLLRTAGVAPARLSLASREASPSSA